MIKIDLITGFLGSGKTSFIKKYAKYLIDQGEKICILENDYGAINIDMVMLKELLGPGCELEMVVGGDGKEAHQRRFRTKLISMGMLGYTRVIIEPSGIYDMDEFFDTLCESPLDRWYEIGSVISIVDGSRSSALSPEAEYLLMSESACAGKLLISKLHDTREPYEVQLKDDNTGHTDSFVVSESAHSLNDSPEKSRSRDVAVEKILNHLNETMERFSCKRRFSMEEDVIAKDWDTFTEQDFEALKKAGFRHASHVKLPLSDNSDFQSLFYLGFRTGEKDLRDRLGKLLEDTEAGNIIRIKGFMRLSKTLMSVSLSEAMNSSDETKPDAAIEDMRFIEVNATREHIDIKPMAKPAQEVLIIIGERLDKNRIAGFFPGAVTV